MPDGVTTHEYSLTNVRGSGANATYAKSGHYPMRRYSRARYD